MMEESLTRKPKVIIVDDEEDFRLTLKDILEVKGYEVITVEDGKKALQEIRRVSFDIGLIDLNLPDVSGVELIQTVKLYSPETEVIMITGSPSLPSAVKALNAGAFGYIEKPYNVDRLFIILERALERQHLIKVLRESEASYRHLFEEVGSAILLLNLKTFEIRHPNKAFNRLFGYTETELGTISFRDFFAAEDYIRLEQSLERVAKESKASLETMLRRKGASPFWAGIYFTLINDSFGMNHLSIISNGLSPDEHELKYALVLITDLTKHKEAEIDLLKPKSYLEAIFSGIGSGLAVIDSNYTIQDANPVYCKFYGYPLKEIIGKKCYEIHHRGKMPCGNLGEVCPIQTCRVLGNQTQVFHEHSIGDSNKYLEIKVTPLKDKKGNLTSFISVQNDLTEIRQANQQLEAKSKELEALNRAINEQKTELQIFAEQLKAANTELTKVSQSKSDFVSTVSHEMRTPLTAIMEGVSLVGDGSLGQVNAEQRQFLTLVKNNTKRLTNLIDNLLDISKIEAGRFEITPAKLDLEKTIRELTNSVGPLVREKELTLKLVLPPEIPPVLADEPSIFRVMMNLVSNAVKFTPAGGTITIRAEMDRTGSKQAERAYIVISVIDTGTGIPKDQQQKLFNKFQQIVREGQPRPSGTGLGLALSKELVELNQGKIWVESEADTGSKFKFSLPLYNEFDDLKITFDLMVKDCREAAVPFVLHLFQVSNGKALIQSGQMIKLLDTIEKTIKAKTLKSDMVRRLTRENSIVIISAGSETNPKTHNDLIRNSLRKIVFLVNDKPLDLKFKGSYCVFEPSSAISVEQALATCKAKNGEK